MVAIYFLTDEIQRARELDLLTYLQEFEPLELVKVNSKEYSTRTHDSLKISNGKWMWWSRGFGGSSALDYLVKVKGYNFIDAVSMILGREVKTETSFFNCDKPGERKLLLPEKSESSAAVYHYLFDRAIDTDVINYCINNDLIYESLPYHNAVFVGYDGDGKPRYGAYRALCSKRICGEVSGSNKSFSFSLMCNTSTGLHVFESAIDLLSYATIHKEKDGNFLRESMLSLAGVYVPASDKSRRKLPKALARVLDENQQIEEVHLHLDNDVAGRIAARSLVELLEKTHKVSDEPPLLGKDYNEYLMIISKGDDQFHE